MLEWWSRSGSLLFSFITCQCLSFPLLSEHVARVTNLSSVELERLHTTLHLLLPSKLPPVTHRRCFRPLISCRQAHTWLNVTFPWAQTHSGAAALSFSSSPVSNPVTVVLEPPDLLLSVSLSRDWTCLPKPGQVFELSQVCGPEPTPLTLEDSVFRSRCWCRFSLLNSHKSKWLWSMFRLNCIFVAVGSLHDLLYIQLGSAAALWI